MAGRSRSRSSKTRRAASLPDDLIAEILARVPYRSLCRFKCVSRTWLALCSDPGVLRRCPQTLSGFFFRSMALCPIRYIHRFVNASGRGPPMADPSLSFLPPDDHRDVDFVDCCNGLLLCKRENMHSGSRYFVCNPATQKWIDLPVTEATTKSCYSYPIVRLGFDPAVSSHFRVFVLVHITEHFDLQEKIKGVEIYSSETGEWKYKQSEWGDGTRVSGCSAFFNGTLHLTTRDSSSVVTVDIDGKRWRNIPAPDNFDFIGLSQGHLYAVRMDCDNNHQLSVWALEDNGGQQWILKHKVSALKLLGTRPSDCGESDFFVVRAIHPEHSLIFFTTGKLRSLMSYDMDNRKVRAIWTLGENSKSPYPYIPCF